MTKTIPVLAAATLLGVASVHAQTNYPNRPIGIPFAARGSPDVNARSLASQLDGRLGKNVVIDNRAGANGTIGAEIVARATPYGHTLLPAALQTPKMKALMEAVSFQPAASSSEDFRRFLALEMKRYAEIVKAAGVRAD